MVPIQTNLNNSKVLRNRLHNYNYQFSLKMPIIFNFFLLKPKFIHNIIPISFR